MNKTILTITSLSLLSATLIAPYAAHADEQITQDPHAMQIVRQGDLDLTCAQLIEEARLMNDIIQTTEDLKSDAKFNNHAVAAAAGVGSFVVGTLTAGIGLAAAAFMTSQNVEKDEQSAESIQDIAHQRRALMVGIHKATPCEEPIDEIMIEAKTKTLIETSNERLANVEPATGDALIPFNE